MAELETKLQEFRHKSLGGKHVWSDDDVALFIRSVGSGRPEQAATAPRESKYIVQAAEGTTCPTCGTTAQLLCHRDMPPRAIAFYICFPCRFVGQIGVGPVTKVE